MFEKFDKGANQFNSEGNMRIRLVGQHTLLPFHLAVLFCALSLTPGAGAETIKSTITYRQVDGHDVLADIYLPGTEGLHPAIVWVHGGALIMGNRKGVPAELLAFASREGFAVVSIDYRLAPETKLPSIIEDLEKAFEWIATSGKQEFGLDPNRIVVCGGSAGGYLTLVSGYRATPRPRALVALYGYGDLIGEWYSTPSPHPRHNRVKYSSVDASAQSDGKVVSDASDRNGNGGVIYNYYRQQGIWPEQVSGYTRDSIRDSIRPFEPVHNVTAVYPPTLLIHGDKDTDVPYHQSKLMVKQFRKHDVDHTLITIKNGEHGLGGGNPSEIQAAYQRMQQFIAKHLR